MGEMKPTLDIGELTAIAKKNVRPDYWPDPCVAKEMVEKYPATFLALLDAARAEGRGEETRTVEVCPDCDIADCLHIRERRKQAARAVLDMYASPIREPEISRTELIKLLTGFLVATEDGWPLHDDATPADMADAILNLAPVGGRGEGWRPIETAPKDGTAILGAWTSLDGPTAYGVITWDAEAWIENFTPVGAPNRWQPLPPPPQEQANEESQTNGS